MPLVTIGHTILHDPTSAELALLQKDERDREFGTDKRRQQYLCGRSLLRRMLQNWTGERGASHQITTTKEGKPICINGPAISITHSGEQVACSIAESGDVGIDLEVIDERRDGAKLAKKFFSEEESAWLETQARDRFFMLWVLKEAYVKAVGRSIFGGINCLRCRVVPPDIDVLGVSDRMREFALYEADGRFLALASTEVSFADTSIEYWHPDADELVSSKEFRLLATSGDLAE